MRSPESGSVAVAPFGAGSVSGTHSRVCRDMTLSQQPWQMLSGRGGFGRRDSILGCQLDYMWN